MSAPPCIIGACDSSVKLEGLSIEQLRIAAAAPTRLFWMSVRNSANVAANDTGDVSISPESLTHTVGESW